MKYIKDLREGEKIADVYFCKHKTSAVTKNGKAYENVILQDKTGTIDAKIWDPNSPGIDDYDALTYVDVVGEINNFQGQLQVNVKRIRVVPEDEVNVEDYMPTSSKNIDEMFNEVVSLIESIKNKYYKELLINIFIKDEAFKKVFVKSSAAKVIHHGFIGGLLEHTLSVAKLCDYFSKAYPYLNRDLLITAALCHDIGKTKELSAFPENDYTDEGQYLGHIVMGSEMVANKAKEIEGFPKSNLLELQHCIVAHHGKLEYGSPKVPSLIEAVALNYADDTDAKLETFKEALEGSTETGWLGYNRALETNIRATRIE